MKTITKNIGYLLMAISLSISSCDKILEVQPTTYIEAENALTNIIGVQAALNGAYAGLRNANYYARNMVIYPDLLADNLRLVQSATQSGRGVGIDVNNPGNHLNIWSATYDIVQKVNVVIDATETVSDGTEAQRATIKGQALFLRALAYFDLLRTYSYNPNHLVNGFDLGVPLITEAVDDYTKITLPARATVLEGYTLVERDLLEAIAQLSTSGVNQTLNTPYYGSKAAAHALLSRLYLYWAGDKLPAAIEQATLALSSGVGTFQNSPSGYLNMWAAPTKPESLFEVQFASVNEVPQTSNNNTIQAYLQQELSGNQLLGWGDAVMADNLLSIYEPGDIRQQVVVPYTRSNGEPVVQTDKFSGSKGVFGWDNVPVIRISEVYLNRAEAYARNGQTEEAQADLNLIRQRCGLSEIFPSGPALLEAILKERRLELAFEGHRFFDLTRLGMDIPKETISPIPFSDYRILAPIPASEFDINNNLIQNSGY